MILKNASKLLIIDDERELLDSLKLSLERYNFTVTICSNTKQALEEIRKEQFDLVLIDIEMPITSGLDFITTLKKSFDVSIPIVIMSGKPKTEYLTEAIRLEVADFISKPINTSELIDAIITQIRKSKRKSLGYELSSSLSSFTKTFIFYSDDFFHNSISYFLHADIIRNFDISLIKKNELFLILDEVIANAFIHGLWNLSPKERNLEKEALINLAKLKSNEFKKQKNRPCVAVKITRKKHNMIQIITKDSGKGFNYTKYLSEKNNKITDLNSSTGRGLALIATLSEKVAFNDDGSQIKILFKTK